MKRIAFDKVFAIPSVAVLIGACSGASSPPASLPSSSVTATADATPSLPKQSSPRPAGETPRADESGGDRAAMWSRFVAAFLQGADGALAEWSLGPGLLLLDNPGAFTRVALLSDVPALLHMEGRYDGARVQGLPLVASVTAGSIPQASCEEPSTSRQGTFIGPTDGAFLTVYVDAMEEYELAPAAVVARLREVVAASKDVEKFLVYDTKNEVRFLFGIVDGRAKLLAVDAVIPCSA